MSSKIRRTWGDLRPTERVHERAGRRGRYSREDEKRALEAMLSEDTEAARLLEQELDNAAHLCDTTGHE